MSEIERDELLGAVVAELRRPVRLSPDFDTRVMAAVRSSRHEGRFRAGLRWLAAPRDIRVSPLGALAAAAGLAGLILASGDLLETPADRAATVADAPAARTPSLHALATPEAVQFVLAAPGASGVSLVGDFNDWDPSAMPLRPTADGAVWSVTVPLSPGRHEYAFVVDGSDWVPDPAAPPSPGDDFGEPNSVITVASGSL